ncbi:MAG: hypothetical protein KJ893_02905 [Candidatus Omnitrophica bacterium]|nr:hypothetical protein [Candidatus Omnitrophota bacterium]MBU4478748.1 hypothetical protein [Candidatus Omnitrophota bacterium]MCG2704181.1 hypothetical protein [Candidatus Omnitrophota bacterium]
MNKVENFSHEGTKSQRKDMNFEPLSEKEESIAEGIVDAAYTLHINFNVPVIKDSIKRIIYF